MKKEPGTEKPQSLEEEIWGAISAFEQILEALPTDRTSLETLAGAYEQIGDHARAKDYLVRLAEVLLGESDYEAAGGLIEKLRAYTEYDAGISELVARVEKHVGEGTSEGGDGGTTASTGAVASAEGHSVSKFSIAAEMSMAWNLMEAGELTQEEYALVVQDLTEMSGQHSGATVSTLHVLEAHGGIELERIMGFLSRECGTPIISLDNFEFSLEVARLLPRDFIAERGAIVFELLGPDALVAILNPYDPAIRKDVKTLLGKDCHFYIVSSSQFDRRVERMDDTITDESA